MTAGARAFDDQIIVGGCRLLQQGKAHGSPVPWHMAIQRIDEIELIIRLRTGGAGLDTDDASAILLPCLNHIVLRELHVLKYTARRAPIEWICAEWCRRWLPAVTPEQLAEALPKALSRPCRYRAETLGQIMALRDRERRLLGVRTIAAIDVTADERAEERRAADRLRKAASRAKVRAALPPKPVSDRQLARELHVSAPTIARWRRAGVLDAKLADVRGADLAPERDVEGAPAIHAALPADVVTACAAVGRAAVVAVRVGFRVLTGNRRGGNAAETGSDRGRADHRGSGARGGGAAA